MKRIILRLLPGVIFFVLFVGISFSTYTLNLYFKAEPGFNVSKESRTYSVQEKEEIVTALVQLSQISEVLGLQRFYTMFVASAGAITGEKRDLASEMTAKYYLSKAVAVASQIAKHDNNYNPLLETYFSYGLFLKDIGQKNEAVKLFEAAIEVGKKNDPQNYWIGNLERALKSTKERT